MHRARSFFYVCAGLFVLALAYHLGARNAGAQAPGSPVVAMEAIQGSRFHVMTANGDLYTSCCGTTPTWSFVGNVFGGAAPGSPVVAMSANEGRLFFAMTANGDLYTSCCGTTPTWSFVGNVFGGPVPAQRETFGALKSRYRGAPGAAQPAPQDR